MKRLLLPLLLATSTAATAQVGIGTTSPDTSAALDISSPAKALIIPRLTTAAINAIANPQPGMLAFNRNTGQVVGYVVDAGSTVAFNQSASNTNAPATLITQTFTAPSDILLTNLGLFCSTSGFGFTMLVNVYKGIGNGGPLISTASVSIPASGNLQTLNVPFSSIFLEANAVYTFRLSIQGSGMFQIAYSNADPYPGGESSFGTGTDLRFAVSQRAYAWKPLAY